MGFKCTYLFINISYFVSLFFCLFSLCRDDWYVFEKERNFWINGHFSKGPKGFGLMDICGSQKYPEPCPNS